MNMDNNIEVAARIRPPIHSNHLAEDVCLYADPYAKEIVLANQMSFYVDHALPLEISQSQLFDSIILPRIDYMLQGYDVSFIAYGHVNSGKTFTMLGPGLHCASSETTYGIVPRSGREMFNKLSAFHQRFGLQFKVAVSFIEVCNEEVKDLLVLYNNTSSLNRNIGFKTNERGLNVLYGVEEIECHNASEFFNCLRLGMSCRKTMKTHLNLLSSLSHCVVIIKVEQKWFNDAGKQETISSRAMFVDLAGSEQSPIDSNQAYNSTLVGAHYRGLGVISAIIASFSGQWLPSSPFTQSLLYPLLKDSFTGFIKTLLICCLSPSSSDYSETLNSLRLIHHILTLNKYSLPNDNVAFSMNNDNHSENANIETNDLSKNASGLKFAASQWLKLVSNAEGLFNKLVDNNMPPDAREEIEEWLCLKQECEDCFGAETRTVINNNKNQNPTGMRSLEIIEEVTETTDSKSKSDSSSENDDESVLSADDDSISASDSSEDENEGLVQQGDNIEDINLNNTETICLNEITEQEYSVNNDYQREIFTKKLNHLMNVFVSRTNEKVDSVINVNVPVKSSLEQRGVVNKIENVNACSSISRCLIGRRKSILPHGSQILLKDLTHDHNITVSENLIDESRFSNLKSDDDCEYMTANIAEEENKETEVVVNGGKELIGSTSPEKAFQVLTTSNCVKQTQLGLANLDLEAASKRLEKLQSMIRIKEQFIQEMIKNSGTRIMAKAKFQRKHVRLEEDYENVKLQLAKAEEALSHEAGNIAIEDQVQKYKSLVNQYEKRLQDIEMIKQIAGDSAKKVLELENSLHSSRRKMQKLRKQLKKEEEHKYSLETEIIEDQKRIKLLEEKCGMRGETLSITGCDGNRLQLTSAEEENSTVFKSFQNSQPLSVEKQMLTEKQERPSCKKNVSKGLLLVSARLSHLEQLMNDNSIGFKEKGDLVAKEALRHEIRNLRKTRDCLLEERKNLDIKLVKDRVLTAAEERKLIECDEAIEAIDATIEYKNELICGRKGLVALIENVEHEKSEQMLLLRLMKLSTVEMQILLYKYFRKVVDLRENGRKMETQITELDRHAETQAWKIQALSNALQQAHLESERRLIAVQKEHQEKLHLIFQHFADETSGHSSGADDTEKCRRQNKALKQRVLELEAMLYKARSSGNSKGELVNAAEVPLPIRPPSNIPQHNLKQLGGASAQHTTKVTRQKNKLIIQQQKTDKKISK